MTQTQQEVPNDPYEDVSRDFRDPKVWRHGDCWYMRPKRRETNSKEDQKSATEHRMIRGQSIAFAGVSLSEVVPDPVAAQRGDEPIVYQSHTLVGQQLSDEVASPVPR